MIPLEYEINRLKSLYTEMHKLVRSQIALARQALLEKNVEAASEAIKNESRVNFYEITIDRETEDFIALQQPVASDLRLVISILKMAGNLERIGDHAYSISSFVFSDKMVINAELNEYFQFPALFDEILNMFDKTLGALENKDAKLAKTIFKQDKILNKINKKTPKLIEKYVKDRQEETIGNLVLISKAIGKLERTGDLLKNNAEEIIFYIKSDVIKHKKKNKKIRRKFDLPDGH